MGRRRFYAPPESFSQGGEGTLILSPDESRHLRDVLRLRAGDEAFVFDGEGREFVCSVADAGGRGAGARLEVRGPAEPPRPESPLALTLAVALLKGEKFDAVVQKATELGARRVAPLLTKRADVRPRDERDSAHKVERWRRLALEASKQSGRARVPVVGAPESFDSFVKGPAREGEARLLFSERDGTSLADVSAERPAAVTALVGPEGGWDDAELELARAHRWGVITLGGRTLRAETAAVAVCVLLQHVYGDLR